MGRLRSRTPVPKRYLMTTKQQQPLRTNRINLAKQKDIMQNHEKQKTHHKTERFHDKHHKTQWFSTKRNYCKTHNAFIQKKPYNAHEFHTKNNNIGTSPKFPPIDFNWFASCSMIQLIQECRSHWSSKSITHAWILTDWLD